MNCKNASAIPWDDYRYLLAIARARGLPRAAETMGVTVSTVFRRLEKLEERFGGPLFHKTKAGYEPNEICHGLLASAERMEQEVHKSERMVTGLDQELVGTVKITASEVLGPFFVARHLPVLSRKHPGLNVDIIAGNHTLNLSEREADIALRPVRPREPDLFGRRISDIRWGVYGAKTRRKAQPAFNDLVALSESEFIGFGGDRIARLAMLEQRARLPNAKIRLSTNSLISTASLASAGAGYALLPCVLGEQWPGLKCYAAPMDHHFGELWIVCHKDLRRNARVRTVFDYFIEAATNDANLFLGPR